MNLDTALQPYKEYLLKIWGEEYLALIEVVERLTQPWQETINNFTKDLEHLKSSPICVFFGERTELDEQYEASHQTMLRFQKLGVNARLLFSGGVADREWAGEKDAQKLKSEFIRRFGGEFEMSLDEQSMNTGMQATLLADLAKGAGVRTFVLALPKDHIARFAAALGEALKDCGLLDNCKILPLACGDWETSTCSGKLTMAREAFGPAEPMSEKENIIENELRQRAGQCGKRWFLPMTEKGSERWICGSLSPVELLNWL
ncbi:MAG: hypothetical protein ABH826_05410 [Patescibacteria group bacterium]